MNVKLSKLKKLNFLTSKEKINMNLYLINIKKNKTLLKGLKRVLKKKLKILWKIQHKVLLKILRRMKKKKFKKFIKKERK